MSTSSSFRQAGKNPDRKIRVFGVTANTSHGHILTAAGTTVGAHGAEVAARSRQHSVAGQSAAQTFQV